MDSKYFIKICLLMSFAAALSLCSCSGNGRQVGDASPTPYNELYTARPADTAPVDGGYPASLTAEQMDAQAKRGIPWYVRVDACNQIISVYAMDKNKKYTLLVNRFACSTPAGIGAMLLQSGQGCPLVKKQWEGDPVAPGYYSEFSISIGGKLLLRSVPLFEKDENQPDGGVYNNLTLNTNKSYIVIAPDDAGWLYDNLLEGAIVEVVYDTPDPDLVQSLMPAPYVEGCGLCPDEQEFTVRATSEPGIAWTHLNQSAESDSSLE